jgi:hypothetical protein
MHAGMKGRMNTETNGEGEQSWISRQSFFDLLFRLVFTGFVVQWVFQSIPVAVIGGLIWFAGDMIEFLVFKENIKERSIYKHISLFRGIFLVIVLGFAAWNTLDAYRSTTFRHP